MRLTTLGNMLESVWNAEAPAVAVDGSYGHDRRAPRAQSRQLDWHEYSRFTMLKH